MKRKLSATSERSHYGLRNMLDNNDRKMLGHFVHACNLLVARFITSDDLKKQKNGLL